MLVRFLAALALVAISAFPAFADDWVAAKLRGSVLQQEGGAWVPLHKGDVVSDARIVRTEANGRVEFHRDRELITLGGDTQIRIKDRTGQRFTTVMEDFGSVTVDAEVKNVQHFAVQTPFAASVVKGTKFVVVTDKNGSRTSVLRGHVEVTSASTHSRVIISRGQSATAEAGHELSVEGSGTLPVVVDRAGLPVTVAPALTKKQIDDAKKAADKAAKDAAKAAKDAAKAAEKAAKDAKKADGKGKDEGKDKQPKDDKKGKKGKS